MKKIPILIVGAALLGFLFGLANLFRLRFENGDNFPLYSSYRADPVGTKALYDSLDSLVSVRRHLRPLARLGDGRDTTLLWLGTTSLRLQPDEFKELETFVRSGGRLVIAAAPLLQRPRTNVFTLAAATGKGAPIGGLPTNAPPGLREAFRKIDIQDRWGLAFDYVDLLKRDGDHFDPSPGALQRGADSPALPRTISLHSALYFRGLDPDWRVLYARVPGTNLLPVLIERPMGHGSIVLFADSFYFSNEALREERQSGLLSWLIGPSRQVLFEETHLGTAENPGVAALARKYRLQPLFLALLALALLFIWKNASRFMPPCEEQLARERGETVEGRDSAGALVNLLQRGITPSSLLRVCLEQWNTASAGLGKPARHKLEAMQRLIDAQNALPPRDRDPVGTYREFCRILAKSSGFRVPGSGFFSQATHSEVQPTQNPKPETRNFTSS